MLNRLTQHSSTRTPDGAVITWYRDNRYDPDFDTVLAEIGIEGVACWGGGFTDPWDKKTYEGKFTRAVKQVMAAKPHANVLIICSGNDIYPDPKYDMVAFASNPGATFC